MRSSFSLSLLPAMVILCFGSLISPAAGEIRDGGIDPWNLGKGDWIYSITDATNKVGGHTSSVTNENSLMLFYKSQGIRYFMIKAATSDQLFNGCYSFPQLTPYLISVAHSNGILVFAYNRSYGANVAGEIGLADYYFTRGADGFVFDAEAEWESNQTWIGTNGPAKAWQLCSAVRSNWPTKFLAHAPFPIISLHSSFPYKEFGYWCDAVMPQIYHFSSTGIKKSPSAAINWSDVNWRSWQQSLVGSSSIINGQTIYWTNSIKPITPLQDVYGPIISGGVICEGTANPYPDKDVLEFIDYSAADPHAQTVGGYQGVNFWRTDLQGAGQWANIKNGTSGNFPGVVNNIVIDDPRATTVGPWTAVKVFGATTTTPTYYGATGTDTNSFGTNYLTKAQGAGAAYVQFTPNVIVAGDYDIYQWHPFRTNASAGVPFVVTHSAGVTTVYANQQTNWGSWSLLGRFNFEAGTGGNIRVTDGLLDVGTVALADGIKLIFVPPASPPATPGGLGATAISTNRIDLAWTDRSTNESGFVLASSTNQGGPYVDIASLPANSTNYAHLGLLPNTTYYYVVRAINVAGASSNSIESSATTLPLAPTPPIITKQPQNRVALPGAAVSFTVTASGTPPLTYQWRFNGADLAGATQSDFTVNSTSSSNGGLYSVRVTNQAGVATSSNALLSVVATAAWGDNSWGQNNLPPSVTNAVAVAAGSWHTLALSANGVVLGWGNNSSGQCAPPPSLTDALTIAAGGYHSLAIKANRTVAAWGGNAYGQAIVPAAATDVIAIAAGTWHSLALLGNGTVIGWGDNSSGQSAIPPGISNITSIAAGGNHSLALKADGTVVAWGENTDADGVFAGQSVVPPGLSNVVAISAGEYHSLAVTSGGAVMAWGDNSHNQCLPASLLNGIVAVAAGGQHSVALKSDGSLVAWGANGNGQCDIPPGVTNAVVIATGHSHTVALVNDGTLKLRLVSPALHGDRFSALLQTWYRRTYAFESKVLLNMSNWTTLSFVSGNGALRMLDDASTSAPQGFYRVRQW